MWVHRIRDRPNLELNADMRNDSIVPNTALGVQWASPDSKRSERACQPRPAMPRGNSDSITISMIPSRGGPCCLALTRESSSWTCLRPACADIGALCCCPILASGLCPALHESRSASWRGVRQRHALGTECVDLLQRRRVPCTPSHRTPQDKTMLTTSAQAACPKP